MANLPVPIPRTFGVSETEVAAYFNAFRDALNFLLNPPEARVYGNAVQAIANNTNTALACDTTVFDTYTMHSNVTNNTRVTAQVAGTYLCIGCYGSAPNAAGGRDIQFAVNGVAQGEPQGNWDVNQANFHIIQVVSLIVLNAGDYVEVWGLQNSGGALNTIAARSSLHALWQHA